MKNEKEIRQSAPDETIIITTPPVCKSIRPEDPGFGCELYLNHNGEHTACGYNWAVGKYDEDDK